MKLTRRLAFISGILGTLAVVLLTVLGGANFPGYRHASQFISELGAAGAPHARLVNLAGFLPAGILITAFAFFAWRSLPRSWATTFGMLGLALFAMGYIAAAFFPCEAGCRPVQPSLSQVLHNLLGLAGYVTAPPSLVALGWGVRGASRGLSVLGFVGGGLALLALLCLSPDFRYLGIAQRVLESSVLAWVVVCAIHLNCALSAKVGRGSDREI